MNEKITDDKGNEWAVIKSVGKVFGTTLNSKELSIALKNDVFHPDGGIAMHLRSGKPYLLNMVYKCSDCEKIHLSYFPPSMSAEDKKEFLKEEMYLDRSDSFVSIEDLTFLLDSFKDAQDIGMETFDTGDIENMEDLEGGTFTCTQVMKCGNPECRTAHLNCYYYED